MIYAPDANILSYAMKGLFSLREKLGKEKSNKTLAITPVSYYEIIRGLSAKNATRTIAVFDNEYLPLANLEFSEEDWRTAINVYTQRSQKGHPIDDDDVLQAAYCINRGFTLVTHNVKHFDGITGLQFEDWVVE
jgi:tRNA(fMet)-specific endonuclease VapC